MKKKQQVNRKGVGRLTSEEITGRGGEIEVPDVQKMYESHYAGKTKKTLNPDHGVPIIQDVPSDPYKGVSKKSKVEGDVDNTVAFDRKAYKEMEE